MPGTVTETFFLPDELGRESISIPADLYNICHTILTRSENDCVFVPIRSLQYLGVITGPEIVFVDSMSYVVNNGHGGRVIMLAWQFNHSHDRDAIDAPVGCDVVYYHQDSVALQLRLVPEFRNALQLMDRRYREHTLPATGARILKLSRQVPD
jgi:hypothetical protein